MKEHQNPSRSSVGELWCDFLMFVCIEMNKNVTVTLEKGGGRVEENRGSFKIEEPISLNNLSFSKSEGLEDSLQNLCIYFRDSTDFTVKSNLGDSNLLSKDFFMI